MADRNTTDWNAPISTAPAVEPAIIERKALGCTSEVSREDFANTIPYLLYDSVERQGFRQPLSRSSVVGVK